MRTLLIHARHFHYRAVKPALKEGYEELDGVKAEGRAENALVVFVTVEDIDRENLDDVVEQVVEDVIDVASKVKADVVVVYPYAHLSSRLAPPDVALEALRRMEERLRHRGIKVIRAPFGWYKEFEVHCYGHPLAELSREFRPRASRARRVEKKFVIVTPDGEQYEPEEYVKRSDIPEDLKRLIEKEALGIEIGEVETPVTRYCRKFGFEWEPLSDYGHMRYEPHATVIMEAVSLYAWRVAQRLGIPVLRIRGTNMFDLSVPPVREHAELFGDRLYDLWADRKHLVLRYAACHQQFAILKDMVLSYRDLPLGMFEIADSYRFEQTGELTLCFRLRKFHMPDLHILVRDLDEAVKVSERVQKVIHEEVAKLDRRYVAVYNVTSDFFEERFDTLRELIARDGRPALVTIYPAGIYYWVLNVEYHIVDVAGRPREIATYQFDVGNAKRFGIKYVDEKNEERYPVIIHTALIGSVERYIYMVFDTAAQMEKRGKTPYIPTWMAPIQVRIIPVSKEQLDYALSIAEMLDSHGIRVDVDDRDLSLGRKIRDAGREWVPYIGVVGEREVKTGTINVTIRRTNERRAMRPEELLKMVEDEVRGYPRVDRATPMLLSKRPTLVYLEK
ncbi:threonine--tRNA ligase [Pyrolobus fumarii]|uniref:threonine--tRNA ligase n=1 Tax=Pyrolobus fumarii TaxID=54252 RepID=UPI00064EC669